MCIRDSYKDNVGEVKGKGYEIILKSNIINKTDWNFNVYFNLAHDKRKFVKIAESLKAYNKQVEEHFQEAESQMYHLDGSVSEPFKQYVEGGSLTPIYAMRSLGIDPVSYTHLALRCYYDATEMKANTLTKNSLDVMKDLDGPLTITTYVNMLDEDYFRFLPKYYNDDMKQFEKYIRFKPEIKMKYVYYYDKVDNSSPVSYTHLRSGCPCRKIGTKLRLRL